MSINITSYLATCAIIAINVDFFATCIIHHYRRKRRRTIRKYIAQHPKASKDTLDKIAINIACTTNATERATIFAEPYIFAFACLCGLLAAISSL